MSQIYYNYEKNTIVGVTRGSLSQSINAKNPAPITNIKYNDAAFFMQSMYFYKPAGATDTFLIIRHVSDPNMADGKVLYLAAKIAFGGSTATEDLDAFLGVSTTPANLELTLNNYIQDGDDARIETDTTTGAITVTLAHGISVHATKKPDLVTFYRTVISDLHTTDDVAADKNAIVRKSILDWSISCEMEGEDMDTQSSVATKSSTSDLMDNINMVMAFVLSIGGMYIAAPEIYSWFIVPILNTYSTTSGPKPITSINMFWNVAVLFLIIEMIVFGAAGKGSAFYILAIGLILVLFAINKSLEDSIGDGQSLFNAPTIKVHDVEHSNDLSYISMFTESNDKITLGVKAFCVMSMFGLWGSNFNLLADDKITNDQAIKQYLVSFPNYFMYGITVTLWTYNSSDNLTWTIAKWAALLSSMGWFAGSMFAIFKK